MAECNRKNVYMTSPSCTKIAVFFTRSFWVPLTGGVFVNLKSGIGYLKNRGEGGIVTKSMGLLIGGATQCVLVPTSFLLNFGVGGSWF